MSLFTKANQVERKLKVLVFGESGVGKTIFGLSFQEAGRVAVIDLEGGTALYGAKYDFDVLRARDFATVIKAVEEIKADAGRTYSTLIIDPITVLWGNLQDAGQQLAEHRAKTASRVGGIADVVLSQRDWGIIKRQYTKLMTDLVNLPLHVVLIARQKDLTDKEGNRLGVTFDGEKSTPYLPDIILHMTGGKDYTAIVKKDRSGTYPLGATLKAPTFTHFAKAVSHGVTALLPDEDAATDATASLLIAQETPAAQPERTLEAVGEAIAAFCKAHNYPTKIIQTYMARYGFTKTLADYLRIEAATQNPTSASEFAYFALAEKHGLTVGQLDTIRAKEKIGDGFIPTFMTAYAANPADWDTKLRAEVTA